MTPALVLKPGGSVTFHKTFRVKSEEFAQKNNMPPKLLIQMEGFPRNLFLVLLFNPKPTFLMCNYIGLFPLFDCGNFVIQFALSAL